MGGWRVAYTKNKEAAQKVSRARMAGANGSQHQKALNTSSESLTSRPWSLEYLGSLGIAAVDPVHSCVREPKAQGADPDERHIFTNFLQYEMPTPEIVIC